VAPKPVNVVVHHYDEQIAEYAGLGVRRCSIGGSLAAIAWAAFDEAARTLRDYEP
jgi:2-methylisocitrate lyase-like PEP mutase family enzyme